MSLYILRLELHLIFLRLEVHLAIIALGQVESSDILDVKVVWERTVYMNEYR
jgi:hypothetical protein